MYQKMGLLEGIDIVKSSDPAFREQALDLDKNYFVDVEYQGEIVRAQLAHGKLMLHEGGGKYLEIPKPDKIEKWQKNAGKDQRFAWMNSVIGATHYIFGEGEKEYLKISDFPEVEFIEREKIDEPNFAWTVFTNY